MPAELRPSSDFITNVRRILAVARRTAFTAVNSFSDFTKHPKSTINNQQSSIQAELERKRRVIEEKQIREDA